MKIYNLIDSKGNATFPKCYDTTKGYEHQREVMYRYGKLLGRYLMSEIDPTDRIHIACPMSDIDNIVKGVVDELPNEQIKYSLYHLTRGYGRRHITTRHSTEGRMDVCVLVMPILNEGKGAAMILNELQQYSQTEKIILLTPAVVDNALSLFFSAIPGTVRKRLEIITLYYNTQSRFKDVSEYSPAVPNDKSEGTGFLLDTIRTTVRS